MISQIVSQDEILAATTETEETPSPKPLSSEPMTSNLAGKRVGMVVFSPYPVDPRPRRAAEALIKEGMTVDYICEGAPGFPRHEHHPGLHVTRIPIRHYRGGALSYAYQYSLFILVSSAIFAWRMLRRRYDLIYVNNMPDILVISALLPKLFGAKVILDQHDPMPELMMTIFGKSKESFVVRAIRFQERWSLRRAHLVITVNEACRAIFSRRSCSADRIAVVMNSPDEKIFSYRPAKSYVPRAVGDPFIIMYHGSLVERNGVDLAVEALARIREKIPQAELRIYGASSAYLRKVMEDVVRRGLSDRVRYLGMKKLEELVEEIQHCDVGVIPNQRNEFTDINTPTRLFEYLALGKPIIAPATPGIEDYFNTEGLLFFESGNAEDLAARIEFAAMHPTEMNEIAHRGQQVYLAHTWQQERQTLVRAVSALFPPKAV